MSAAELGLGDALRVIMELAGPQLDADRVNEPDRELARLVEPVLGAIKHYFRAEVSGLERIPEGRALLVGNHNAGITSFDPILLGLEWYRRSGGEDFLFYLGHDIMAALPVVGNFLLKLGMIRADHEVAAEALRSGKRVMVFPGGNYEAFRPFTQRHRVDFGGHLGYLRLALRTQTPVVPVMSLGGHETFVVLRRGKRLARWTGVKRLLRSDSFPIFLGLPWGLGVGPIFHLPLPAKLIIEVGDPISLGHGPEAADDRAVLEQLNGQIQAVLQDMMNRRAAERRWPVLG